MSNIHPTAIIADGAELGEDVCVGPYCVIGAQVRLGDGVKLISHVHLNGDTHIGENSTLYPHVSMGFPPQDFKHKGGPVGIRIGSHCTFRENATVHPGTDVGNPMTVIGDHCYFMVGAHIAHEVQVGNHVTLSNYVQVGGNVKISDHVILGGVSAIHQNTRIGPHAFVAGLAFVTQDVIPYGFVMGNAAHLAGLNVIGLKRRGFSRETIHDLRSAYRLLFAQEGTFKERLEDAAKLYAEHELVMDIVGFIRDQDIRAICMPTNGRS